MKKINQLLPFIVLFLLVVVTYQFFIESNKTFNYKDFEIKGLVNQCSDTCLPFGITGVKAVYTGTNIQVEPSYTYGGNAVAQICEDIIESERCTNLDISKLPGYQEVSRPDVSSKFPIYTYINKYVSSLQNKKIYFLYRVLDTDLNKSNWVYDNNIVVVSYNTESKEVKIEGQLSITGLNIKEIHISPNGTHLLIVDSDNPRYIPRTNESNFVIFDLIDKTTKIFKTVVNGGSLKFLTWINDDHFLYYKYEYGNGRDVVFRIASI